ncbi:MAG: ORF6N domain-containing protein [Clostridiales bacterium]|nr:ORF6N domain-containing protein [Clostridiales bacterium]
MSNENDGLMTIDDSAIRSKIYLIRGQQVMLDSDLAALYGYELKTLKSQIVTSRWGGVRKTPYAFTEQGIYMLATVLKGEVA